MNKHQLLENWSPVIEQTIGKNVDASKKHLVATICQLQENYEAKLSGGQLNENNFYAVPGSVNGMGAVELPSSTGQGWTGGAKGSGDVPYSLLPLAIQVAAQTIGLELVPTIPMNSPVGMLSYMDFVYGGGKNGYAALSDPYATGTDGKGANSPIYIKIAIADNAVVVDGATFTISGESGTFTVLGTSRIDGYKIVKLPSELAAGNSIAGLIPASTTSGAPVTAVFTTGSTNVNITSKAELVKGLEDHIVDFSTNQGVSEYGEVTKMTRQEGEAIQSNTGNLQLFSKAVEAKTVQAAAAVTREQLMDLKQFGIDAVAQANQFLANEMTQVINRDILSNIFRLGKLNHENIEAVSGRNYHLILDSSAATYANTAGGGATVLTGSWQYFASTLTVTGVDASNTGAENLGTRQRRLMSRMLAASNIISTRGRRGPATFAVCSGGVASGFQDCAGFVPYPIANTINQVPGALYPLGTLAGIAIYVDPVMAWEDVRIALGRKGDGNTPGLVFMPYVMADTVETIAEGTMAPKLQMKSRYQIVEAGHHPETMYLTFGADDKVDGGWA
tara:strand:- start:69 stop:1751 length:1683 start_codon:yes stop_codon:yes gene_type:complete